MYQCYIEKYIEETQGEEMEEALYKLTNKGIIYKICRIFAK